MLYAKSTGGFYDPAINTTIPTDAVEVSDATYLMLMSAQAAGQVITADKNGNPIAVSQQSLMTLAQVQAAQITILQASYQAAVNAPVTYKNAAGVTSTYPSGNTVAINGATAMQNLIECIDAGAAAWTINAWLDTNNVAQVFTFADLQGLAAAMSAVVSADWKDLVAKVAEVQAAATVAAVQAITF